MGLRLRYVYERVYNGDVFDKSNTVVSIKHSCESFINAQIIRFE